LRQRLLPASAVLVVAHDYPDPDCIAAAGGIQYLLQSWGVSDSVIAFGGFVGRAENRAMLRHLSIEALPFALVDLADFDRIVLVDCMPGGGNVSLPDTAAVDAVLDHHVETAPEEATWFADIRSDLGATSTMVAGYLFAEGLPLSPKLATALFYGIKTDTRSMGRETSDEDLATYKVLFEIMDHKLLSRIESPDRDIDYFRIVHSATESAVSYGTVGYAHLGTVPSPDYVAEMADFFLGLARLEWMICSGVFKKRLFFSIRTKRGGGAGKYAHGIGSTLQGDGGGHGMIGAGSVPIGSLSEPDMLSRFVKTMKDTLRITQEEPDKVL